jgi:hypothetical protein
MMVNAGMVNRRGRVSQTPFFCEILRVFAQIRRFKNPFKYSRRSQVNHREAPAAKAFHRTFNSLIFRIHANGIAKHFC